MISPRRGPMSRKLRRLNPSREPCRKIEPIPVRQPAAATGSPFAPGAFRGGDWSARPRLRRLVEPGRRRRRLAVPSARSLEAAHRATARLSRIFRPALARGVRTRQRLRRRLRRLWIHEVRDRRQVARWPLRSGRCCPDRRSRVEIASGALSRLDKSRLPGARAIPPVIAAKLMAYDSSGAYSVAFGWSAIGLLYNADKAAKRRRAGLLGDGALTRRK